LSRTAVELVQDSLAKGCVQFLARRGGWRRERHLRGNGVAEGRLWERTLPAELGLSFTKPALEFLVWITAAALKDKKTGWPEPSVEGTAGDQLLLFLAYETLRELAISPELRAEFFAVHPLCVLAYPEDFADTGAVELDFHPWTIGPGACILEALQSDLRRRWIHVERQKEQIAQGQAMRRLGKIQERVLTALFEAVEKAERRDLASFFPRAMAHLLTAQSTARQWLGGVEGLGGRLADRAEIQRAGLTAVRQLERMRNWETQARAIGYFDEGYAAAQWWKAEWERWEGDQICARAEAIRRQVDPLNAQT